MSFAMASTSRNEAMMPVSTRPIQTLVREVVVACGGVAGDEGPRREPTAEALLLSRPHVAAVTARDRIPLRR